MSDFDGVAARARAEAGLPVIVCPNCGRTLADRWSGHYEPPELGGRPGRYTCRPPRTTNRKTR